MKMKTLLGIAIFICLNAFVAKGQEKVVYIVDSIPIDDEPNPELNNLKKDDVHQMKTITDRQILKNWGFAEFDKAVFITTKPYSNRPEEIKQIPSVNVMEERFGKWYLINKKKPYSGPFINYYLSGDKYEEGTFKDGKLDGLRWMYFDNGNLKMERLYSNGIENGPGKDYYQDGTLKQQGEFANGMEVGRWKMYYPNGQLKQVSTFQKGRKIGETISYYSTGMVKSKEQIVDGKAEIDPETKKLYKVYNEGFKSAQLGNLDAAISNFSKCIKIHPAYAEAYFARGTAYLNNHDFKKSRKDFDKAIELEPYYIEAYGNRAFCLIREHQLKNSKKKRGTGTPAFSTRDDTDIPDKDLEIICSDLEKTIELGNNSQLTKGAYKDYCSQMMKGKKGLVPNE